MRMPEMVPTTAMVLAAGLGKRMRPITETIPKPLVKVAGKPLIDWGLDAAAQAGIGTAIVNVHYLAGQLEAHLRDRNDLEIVISDEREMLLDSAGGIVKALPILGTEPFVILNADTFWVGDEKAPNLLALADAWDADRMDILLMTARLDQETGYEGKGDFVADENGHLRRARDISGEPYLRWRGARCVLTQPLFRRSDCSRSPLWYANDRALADRWNAGCNRRGGGSAYRICIRR